MSHIISLVPAECSSFLRCRSHSAILAGTFLIGASAADPHMYGTSFPMFYMHGLTACCINGRSGHPGYEKLSQTSSRYNRRLREQFRKKVLYLYCISLPDDFPDAAGGSSLPHSSRAILYIFHAYLHMCIMHKNSG